MRTIGLEFLNIKTKSGRSENLYEKLKKATKIELLEWDKREENYLKFRKKIWVSWIWSMRNYVKTILDL